MLAALRVRMEPHVERWLLRRNPPAETVRQHASLRCELGDRDVLNSSECHQPRILAFGQLRQAGAEKVVGGDAARDHESPRARIRRSERFEGVAGAIHQRLAKAQHQRSWGS